MATSGGRVAKLPNCFTHTVESTKCRVVVLFVLVAWAVLTAYIAKVHESLYYLFFIIMLGFKIYATLVFTFSTTVEEPIFISILACLITSGVATIFYKPSAIVTLALTFPYIAMCFRQRGTMHRILSFLALPPLLLQITDLWLNPAWATAFYLHFWMPALTILAYKLTKLSCNNTGSCSKAVKALLFTLFCLSAAPVFGGASLAAISLARQESQRLIEAVVMTMVGGIAFNAVLVVYGKKKQTPATARAKCDGSELRMQLSRIFGIIVLALFMCLDLLIIYKYLEHNNQDSTLALLPVVLLICLHFWAQFLHVPLRGLTPNWLYFLLILASFAAAAYLEPAPKHQMYINGIVRPIKVATTREELREEHLRSTNYLAALECCLVLIYFMMAALEQADKQPSQGEEERFPEREEDGMLPLVEQQPASSLPPPGRRLSDAERQTQDRPSEKLVVPLPTETCCSGEYDEEEREESPMHATLNQPD